MAKKIMFVFGTRPEVIKMAPVIALAKKSGKLEPIVCVTAQHRYLLDQALAEFDIKPDIDLDLMRPNQTLGGIISRVMRGMRDVYRNVRPDLVLVQGDTTTVFAASLAAYYENIDVGHIEAGLRSGDDRNPFPEEINRRFVSLIARYNFCPTSGAKENLLKESVDPKKIFVTGNTVIDALEVILKDIRDRKPAVNGIKPKFLQKPYALITGHRRENFNGGIKNVCTTIRSLAKRYADFHWLWAVHLNPNARDIVFQTLDGLSNVRLIEPVPYREFIYLMEHAKFIVSDSGGVQEEAPSLGKTVFVTRVCTERPEALESGTSVLVGTDPDNMTKHVEELLEGARSRKVAKNPFGDGKAAEKIIDVIVRGSCKEFK
ncbi:MAG: UDP-N-acetylglucosamine 2-epimerase (non-hydrolyzing) [Candidatus Omnitrophota bacterium]|nr:MAG: UDP-N-acetylglucosamine 2-epimerase (non-hydrolyzing) [Candidatus Omnitrophota bacterium]